MSKIPGVQFSGNAPGAIIPCGSSALPRTLICDGSAISRVTYPALFAAIGTTYGAGDGSTTFNVPNLQGVFPRGSGTSNRYTFTITSASATAGAVYSNNGQTFTVLNTISGSTQLIANGTGAPTASGSLTRISGTGDTPISFSSVPQALSYSGTLGRYSGDVMQGHRHGLPYTNNPNNNPGNGVVPSFGTFIGKGTGLPGTGNNNPGTYLADLDDGTNGTPRIGSETAPTHLGVNYCIAY